MLSLCLGYLEGWTSSDEYLEDIQESEDTDFYSWVKNWIQKWSRSNTGYSGFRLHSHFDFASK